MRVGQSLTFGRVVVHETGRGGQPGLFEGVARAWVHACYRDHRRMTPLYWYVPVGGALLVVGSVVWRLLLPHRRDPFTLVLVAGLPVAAVALFVASGLVNPAQPPQIEELPPSEQAELGLSLFLVSLELVLAWFVAAVFVLLRIVTAAALMGRRSRG